MTKNDLDNNPLTKQINLNNDTYIKNTLENKNQNDKTEVVNDNIKKIDISNEQKEIKTEEEKTVNIQKKSQEFNKDNTEELFDKSLLDENRIEQKKVIEESQDIQLDTLDLDDMDDLSNLQEIYVDENSNTINQSENTSENTLESAIVSTLENASKNESLEEKNDELKEIDLKKTISENKNNDEESIIPSKYLKNKDDYNFFN